MKDKIAQTCIIAGMLLVAAGIVIPIATHSIASDTFRYIFAAGALIALAGRLMSRYEGSDTRLKRLTRIEVWGAIFFCAAAALMFYDRSNFRDPVAFILAGGLIQIYTSLMIPHVAKKSEK